MTPLLEAVADAIQKSNGCVLEYCYTSTHQGKTHIYQLKKRAHGSSLLDYRVVGRVFEQDSNVVVQLSKLSVGTYLKVNINDPGLITEITGYLSENDYNRNDDRDTQASPVAGGG